jgi:hypothetical protein
VRIDNASKNNSLGSLKLALLITQRTQIVKTTGDMGMRVAQQLFVHRQGILIKRFGLAVAPLIVVESRQIVEALGNMRDARRPTAV